MHLFFWFLSLAWAEQPREAVVTDLDRIIALMEGFHPSPYYVRSAEEIAATRDAIAASLPEEVDELVAFRAGHALVTAYSDGHTRIWPGDAIDEAWAQAQRWPLPVVVSGASITVSPDIDSPLAGATLESIDGVAVPELVAQLRRHAGRETDALDAHVLSRSFGYHLWLATGWSGPFEVTLQDGETQTLSALPPPAPATSSSRLPSIEHDTIEGDVAYLKIRDFERMGRRGFLRVYREAFHAFHDADATRALIIDVRGHSGGDQRHGARLARYFAEGPFQDLAYSYWRATPELKDAFKNSYVPRGLRWIIPIARPFHPHLRAIYGTDDGENGRVSYPTRRPRRTRYQPDAVFVLMDEDTYSAGTCFVAMVADYDMATLVGRPSGNVANFHADALLRANLPAIGAQMQVANSFLVRPSGDLTHAPVQPDVLLDSGEDALQHTLQVLLSAE